MPENYRKEPEKGGRSTACDALTFRLVRYGPGAWPTASCRQKFLKKTWQGFQKFLTKTSKKHRKQNRLTALEVWRPGG